MAASKDQQLAHHCTMNQQMAHRFTFTFGHATPFHESNSLVKMFAQKVIEMLNFAAGQCLKPAFFYSL